MWFVTSSANFCFHTFMQTYMISYELEISKIPKPTIDFHLLVKLTLVLHSYLTAKHPKIKVLFDKICVFNFYINLVT